MTVRFIAVKDGNLELRSVMEQEMFNAMKFKYKRNMSYELSQLIPKRLYPLPVKKKDGMKNQSIMMRSSE